MTLFGGENCEKITSYRLALSIHGSNYANSITTRTPEGGPYKVKELVCQDSCEVVEKEDVFWKYEPSHPDANTDGYVIYSNISKDREHTAISAYAKAIKGLLFNCEMLATFVSVNGLDSFAVDYKHGKVKSDIFNFNSNSNLSSWVRVNRDGKSHIFNFLTESASAYEVGEGFLSIRTDIGNSRASSKNQ